MLIAIDVGNTNTVISLFDGEEKKLHSRIGTDHLKTSDEYGIIIASIFRMYKTELSSVDGGIISSVVPSIVPVLSRAVKTLTGVECLVVGPGIKTGLNIKIDDPAQLGSDIACVSVSSLHKYPQPSMVFDMGTATTITAMDSNGNFIGGSILPGIGISMQALSERTAQLPHIDLLGQAKNLIGKNTVDCMVSGVMYGSAAMVDGMAERYREELGENLTVIATGGLAPNIVKYCKSDIILDEDLLIDGLRLIYQKNMK